MNQIISIDKEAFEFCVHKAVMKAAEDEYGEKLCKGLFVDEIAKAAAEHSWDMLKTLSDEAAQSEEDAAAYNAALVRDENGNEIYFGKTVEECRKYCKKNNITGADGEYIAVGVYDPKWRSFEPKDYIEITPGIGIMKVLWKEAVYAAESYSLERMYLAYGELKMARISGIVTYEATRDLQNYIMVRHINNGQWRRECEKLYESEAADQHE